MTGEGKSFRNRLRQRFICPHCDKKLAVGFLAAYQQVQHGVAQGDQKYPHPTYDSMTYRISFLRFARDISYPVGVCMGQATSRSAIQVHLMHRHMRDMVVILEEGIYPLPRFPKCDIFVALRAINGRHQATAMRTRG